jgi:putative ABC transport system ATP-binding protein
MTSTDDTVDMGLVDMGTVVCRGVSKTYRSHASAVDALVGVDFTSEGAITALFGPSGSGKSTLLRMLAGLERPDEGDVVLGSHTIGAMSRRSFRRLQRSDLALVFQQPSHNLLEYLTARQQLELAAQLRGRGGDDVDALLDRVGLTRRAAHTPAQLSGGEQQRLAFASAVIGGPRWVLADEPTAELDAASADRVLEVVTDLAAESATTFVLASHDPAVRAIASSVVMLTHGRIT